MIPAIFLVCFAVALLGCFFAWANIWVIARFSGRLRRAGRPIAPVPVTILKPLHGDEPRLLANLSSFLQQQWQAPIQLVAGVQSDIDPAIAAIETLRRRHADRAVARVVEPRRHGANTKISNIINMMPTAQHDILVLSDSDIAVAPDYLARVIASLNQPGVGAVTCVYRGRGDAGFWSVIGAAGISYQFLPGVLAGIAINTGDACMGSTIAIRSDTLDRVGGFERFSDVLADDHAIGAGVRALGLDVAIAPIVVTHASNERSFGELFRHEVRWGATIRSLKPTSYLGTVLTNPFPFALLAFVLFQGPATAALVGASLLSRAMTKLAVDRMVGASSAPLWTLPLRDLLTLGVFIASCFARSVDWQGERLNLTSRGRIAARGVAR